MNACTDLITSQSVLHFAIGLDIGLFVGFLAVVAIRRWRAR